MSQDLSCSRVTQGCRLPSNLPKEQSGREQGFTLYFPVDSPARIAGLGCASCRIFSPLSSPLGADVVLQEQLRCELLEA